MRVGMGKERLHASGGVQRLRRNCCLRKPNDGERVTQVPPHVLTLYLKLCSLIRQRKWKAAYECADSLKLYSKEYR